MYEAARNLRLGGRFLMAPPLSALFGDERVQVCDMSSRGARLRHAGPVETGAHAELKIILEGRAPVGIASTVVWTQSDASGTTGYISGIRLDDQSEIEDLLGELYAAKRCTRIEELRGHDRFLLMPALKGSFGGRPIYMEDLSAFGARIESLRELPPGTVGALVFRLPDADEQYSATARVVWSSLKSITGQFTTYRSGLSLSEQPEGNESVRFAIERLCDVGNAVLDTQSLRLKLKVMRARARSLARTMPGNLSVGMVPEQFLLIEGVRQELRLNPEEAFHWYRRARLSITDPETRTLTPPISDHPDALAVWEYLDRSIDPSIIGRAFELPEK